ncbi:MAG: FAD-binding oxidoreductase [Candidatus Altiarchaeota archaeon]
MKAELEKIVGKENVSEGEVERLVYSQDASQLQGEARIVVWPRSAAQVSDIVKLALKLGTDIVARGGGTSLVGGVIPGNSIVLDMSRMDRVLEVSDGGKYALVEPGVILDDLNLRLKEKRLFFPVIPASRRVCTIGGMISTDAVGERALRYGRTGEWILSLEVVDGRGEIRTLDAKAVKEIVGTEGCVAVITKAKLRLADAIPKRSISVFECDDISSLTAEASKYRKREDVLAVEYVSKIAADLTGVGKNYTLYAEFSSDAGKINDGSEVDRIWEEREGVGAILSSKGYDVKEDPKIPLERIQEFLMWLDNHGVPSFGHISVGIIHPRFRKGQEDKIREMFLLVEKMGGVVSGEHGIGITKREYAPKELVERIKKLKKKYDPDGVFNRGKICQT